MPEEEEYNVDRLLSKRVRGGVTQYEVWWTGFDETTWEPAENLNGTLVQDFEAANRKRSIDLLSPDGKYRGSTCNTTAPLQLGQHVIVPFKGKDCNGPYPAGSIRGVYYIQYHVGAVYNADRWHDVYLAHCCSSSTTRG